jgi:hypothetical protein
MHRRTTFTLRITALAPIAALCLLAGCASTVTDTATGPVDEKRLEGAPFLGQWKSELDGAILTLEPTGVFSVEKPAAGAQAARSVVGTWTFDGTDASFTNLRESPLCADVTGVYRVELVRTTLRFAKRSDECPTREEHMAWPWVRP